MPVKLIDVNVKPGIDDEQFFLKEQVCRMERQNRRSKRKCHIGSTSNVVMESFR
ncbi:hypothetical protein DPMN_025983 [Dreissena polymorpha]|uniref:Uncharacterized protein n=1 Tax=Dreissena polymorpha TaxID=45954 RepID=A0A9D4LSK7_DREPO|nr:hypothetical protein DPMN_025983 [Dreissena polymorpha]